MLLHHPFDSFNAVVSLVKQAAIRMYWRSSRRCTAPASDSVLVQHLVEAARSGKDVTVVIELRARFDEEANLGLADQLQEAGVQVVYGVVGYKTTPR